MNSVVGVVLLVALVTIMGAVVGVYAFDIADDLQEPAPNVAQSTGEFVPEQSGTNTQDNQFVRITHEGGTSVAVEDIEIIIRADGPDADLPKEARLVDLPGSSLGENNRGDNLIDNRSARSRTIVADDSNTWSASDTIQFRVKTGEADFRAQPNGPEADELEVIIVHTPSRSVLYDEVFRP